MPGKLRLGCILQSKFQRSQRYEDWPSYAQRIRGIRGNKLQVESSEQDARSGSNKIPTFLETRLTVRKILSYMELLCSPRTPRRGIEISRCLPAYYQSECTEKRP